MWAGSHGRAAVALAMLAVGVGGATMPAGADVVPRPVLAAAADGAGGLHAVTPSRLLDTRSGVKPAAGTSLTVRIAGHGDIPATGVSAAVVTLTATDVDEPGYVTAWPCSTARPEASNLNFRPGTTTPNLATVAVGTAGDICVFVSAAAHVLVDVSAWYGAGQDRLATVVPTRVADTRQSGHKVPAGQALVVNPAAGIAASGTEMHAVALNVTATEPDGAGFLTVYPCDAAPPVASSVNFAPGQSVADAAIVGLAGDGSVCVFASATTHVVVDVNGWFGPSGLAPFQAQPPRRLVDTRASGAPVAANGVLTVPLPDPTMNAAAINLTVSDARGLGFLTAFACGSARPLASNINFAPGDTVANSAVVPVGAGGAVCFFASAATHVVVDLDGTFGVPAAAPAPGSLMPALQWGYTQVGAPYAALNPFRFGDSIYGAPWKCDDGSDPCTRTDLHGEVRTYRAGSYVYDCSGFVTAAWLRAGVDLVKANAAWTDAMLDHLPHIDATAARPGDIVLFNYSGGGDELNSRTDHAGLFVTVTSMLQAGNGGVSVTGIDWRKVVAVVRPGG